MSGEGTKRTEGLWARPRKRGGISPVPFRSPVRRRVISVPLSSLEVARSCGRDATPLLRTQPRFAVQRSMRPRPNRLRADGRTERDHLRQSNKPCKSSCRPPSPNTTREDALPTAGAHAEGEWNLLRCRQPGRKFCASALSPPGYLLIGKHMDIATLKDQAERCRRLAKHADPFTQKRLLDLASEYDARIAKLEPKPSAALRRLRNGEPYSGS